MSPSTTKFIEQLALDGPIQPALAMVLGAILLALFGWALWRERNVLSRRNIVLFWVLRCAALVTVIWMLLAPNNVRVETSTTRRTVAIVSDVSGSMQTVDPPGTADDLRWAVAASASDKHLATQATDRAIAAIGMAQHQLQLATEALRQHQPESAVIQSALSANAAIGRAVSHLQHVQSAAATGDASGNSSSLAQRLARMLDSSEFRTFDQLCNALQSGRAPSQKGWRESLPDLQYRLAEIRRSLHELGRHVAAAEASQVARESPALLTSVRQAPRLSRAAAFLGQLQQTTLPAIRSSADVRMSCFDQTVRLLIDQQFPQRSLTRFISRDESVRNAPAGTDISAVLEQLQRERHDQQMAAVFILTDMAHNQAGKHHPREVAATLKGTPVYIVPIGNTQHVRDCILQSVYAPAVALRNDAVVIEANLQAYDCEAEICTVQLMQDGEVIDFREVVLDSGFANRTVRFEQRLSLVGNHQFQVAIVPLEGELTEDNNYDEFEVNVTRSDIKVLLADELPRWEYRYLAQLFRRDPKIECDELLFHPRMIATGRRQETKTLPITVDDWDQYDVVLLGDLPPEHLPVAAQESLIEYLQQRGGTLVLIAGREAMPQAYINHPLEEILPVLPADSSTSTSGAGYAFRVTAEGADHHALMIGESEEATRTAWDFVNRFSPLHEVSTWRRPRPSAHTLISAVPRENLDDKAGGQHSAFLCWQPVGRGRILYLSGPETYRLRFLRGDRLHYRFWGQLLRWAIASDLSAGTKFVRLRTDKPRYDTREAVHATVDLKDVDRQPVVTEDLQLQVTSGDQERSVPLTSIAGIPGRYQAEIRSLPPGVYRVQPIGPAVDELQADDQQEQASASFTVQASLPLELVDTRCDRALAQQIADITGGQVVPPTAVEEILKLTNLEPIVTQRIERRPLWLQWKYLWLVFGCLQVEWVIRKWKGLS